MGLFRPAWDSKDWNRAVKAVEKITDEVKLVRVAKEARNYAACLLAVEKLTDQKLLADVAKNSTDTNIRTAAVKKLTNQTLLANIAMTDQNVEVRIAAIQKINDELFVAQYLAMLSEVESNQPMRMLIDALRLKINSLPLLVGVAIATHNDYIGKACLYRIDNLKESNYNDQKLLYSLTQQAYLESVRTFALEVAAKKITDPALLAKFVLLVQKPDLRRIAAEKLTDRPLLEKLALEDTSSAVRKASVERFVALRANSSQGLLRKIALNDESYDVRLAALKGIQDQQWLKDFIYNEKNNESHRKYAIETVSDQQILYEIAKSNYLSCGYKAIENISDTAKLELLASEAPGFYLRLKSFRKLPYANENLVKNLEYVFEVSKAKISERKKAAHELTGMLKQNPKAAAMFWNEIRKKALIPHQDSIHHEDSGGHHDWRSNDCHDDYNRDVHTDQGIGVNFPPYPFED